MMYNNKLAMALKVNGKVLREFKDTVFVPFSAQYSIYIKNLNSVRVLVSVSIDGDDIGDGTQFVIYPNSDIEIERFLPNGNQKKGNRFKFIERTGAVEDHRGVGVEDGLVRIEYNFEKPRTYDCYTNDVLRGGVFGGSSDSYTITSTSASLNVDAPTATYTADIPDLQSVNYSHVEEPVNDAGITVEGSVSDQQFHTASWFPTESKTHVMVLKMLGQTKDNVQVRKAVTVKQKPKCKTCGRVNKATAKFCGECGTSLQIVA